MHVRLVRTTTCSSDFAFAPPGHRLQVSIVETRRADGEMICQEHVAGLGSIVVPPSVADRVAFWQRVHERLAKLSNRIDQETCGKLMGSLHEKIPMPTVEEQRALQRENLEAEENVWDVFHDMHAGAVEETKALAAKAESDIAERRAEMVKAADRRDVARERMARLDRGEAVPGGDKRITRADIIKAFGWSPSDVRHAEGMAALDDVEREAWFKEQFERSQFAARRISKATLRAFLRRRARQAS